MAKVVLLERSPGGNVMLAHGPFETEDEAKSYAKTLRTQHKLSMCNIESPMVLREQSQKDS